MLITSQTLTLPYLNLCLHKHSRQLISNVSTNFILFCFFSFLRDPSANPNISKTLHQFTSSGKRAGAAHARWQYHGEELAKKRGEMERFGSPEDRDPERNMWHSLSDVFLMLYEFIVLVSARNTPQLTRMVFCMNIVFDRFSNKRSLLLKDLETKSQPWRLFTETHSSSRAGEPNLPPSYSWNDVACNSTILFMSPSTLKVPRWWKWSTFHQLEWFQCLNKAHDRSPQLLRKVPLLYLFERVYVASGPHQQASLNVVNLT